MAENYITLKKVVREEFATRGLFDMANALNIKINPFVVIIESQKNPHAKYLIKMIEAVLRAKPDNDLYLDLDDERSQLAAWFEEDLKPPSDQNATCDQVLVELIRLSKSESHKEKDKIPFEIFIYEQLHKLVSKYKETIAVPSEFHKFKSGWLTTFNEKMPRTEVKKKTTMTTRG